MRTVLFLFSTQDIGKNVFLFSKTLCMLEAALLHLQNTRYVDVMVAIRREESI